MIARLLALIARVILHLRYRVEFHGIEEVLGRGDRSILFLPNHPALIDPVILATHLFPDFSPCILADKDQVGRPLIRNLVKAFGIIPMPDPSRYRENCKPEIARALESSAEALRAGKNILLYPAGRLYRSKMEDLGGNSAVETVLSMAPDCRIVLIRTKGLWGSKFSRAWGSYPNLLLIVAQTLLFALLNLFFFAPRRKVTIELCEPKDLPRYADKTVLNRWLERFYNQDPQPNTFVPYTFWKGRVPQVRPEPLVARLQGDLSDVHENTYRIVMERLHELSGLGQMAPSQDLARDLGLDSLSRMELQLWLEQEFGAQDLDPESLMTVGDVLLAAAGESVSQHVPKLKSIPHAWKAGHHLHPILLPGGTSLPEVFLRQVQRGPNRVAIADQASGVRTYRAMLTGILALKPVLENLEGKYVGIMLPASVGAAVVFLAVQLAGKVPVMVNWTVGARNLNHGLKLLGVTQILTAQALVEKLNYQGVKLGEAEENFLFLEKIGQNLSTRRKLVAKFRSYFGWKGLHKAEVQDTAVVLFTSGSENLPKAVPLSHANLLANLRDILQAIRIKPEDIMLGMLPPFHSFGLTTTFFLPLLSGFRAVYHPNPTEGRMLARMIEAYHATLTCGTPTFLKGIIRAAEDPQLLSLRLVITGAEKCPTQVYDSIQLRWPHLTVLEGYGITECSPVVSVNREEENHPGTIGKVLDSVAYAIVDPDKLHRLPQGETGLLLLRGPSVFRNYLNFDGPSPFVGFENALWYRTGDLVQENEKGVLSIAGRLKRFIKLGGEMVSLPAIEEALLARYGRPEDEDVVLAVESTPDEFNPELLLFTTRDIDREGANATLRSAGLSPIHNIRAVRKMERIPVLGSGKTDYRQLKERLQQDKHGETALIQS